MCISDSHIHTYVYIFIIYISVYKKLTIILISTRSSSISKYGVYIYVYNFRICTVLTNFPFDFLLHYWTYLFLLVINSTVKTVCQCFGSASVLRQL